MSAFTGKFYTYKDDDDPNQPSFFPLLPPATMVWWDTGSVEFGLSVVWNRGKLEFGFIDTEHSLSSQEEFLQITAGDENKVGKVGSKLFLLPGKELTIFDYKIELERQKLILLGSCRSIFEDGPRVLPLKIVLGFFMNFNTVYCDRPPLPFTWIFPLRIETKLWEKGNIDPLREESFVFNDDRRADIPPFLYEESESIASSESDEEASDARDSESGINEPDSDSNDNEEGRNNNDD